MGSRSLKFYLLPLIVVLTAFSLAGCTSNEDLPKGTKLKEIKVFAAASLTECFGELAKEFERQELGSVKVVLNFAGSQSLVTSIENGSNADIFAAASVNYMDSLKSKNLIKDYKIFAKNKLVLIKNQKNNIDISKFSDLAADGITLAVGDNRVPVGMYWKKACEEALKNDYITEKLNIKIKQNVKTRELSVKDIVSKVLVNEVDIGVVYRTDITSANEGVIKEIAIPELSAITASYPIAVLNGNELNDSVVKFYNFINSDVGKDILKKYRFIIE